MIIAKVQDRQIAAIGDYRDLFPNVSFPESGPTAKFLAQNNCVTVKYDKRYNKLSEKLVPCPAYYESGDVFVVVKQAMNSAEIQEQKDAAMALLRTKRDMLLTACDWTQIPDSTVDKKVWGTYRTELRNFPSTISDARLPYEFPKAPDQLA